MPKKLLNLQYDFDFFLIGICCHAKDYRLCWEINKQLCIKLVRSEDIIIDNTLRAAGSQPLDDKSYFTLFDYTNSGGIVTFHIISNRSQYRLELSGSNQSSSKSKKSSGEQALTGKGTKTLFIPEQKQVDYFLRVKGLASTGEKENILKKLRGIPVILTSYEIDPKKLRSKQNFLVF